MIVLRRFRVARLLAVLVGAAAPVGRAHAQPALELLDEIRDGGLAFIERDGRRRITPRFDDGDQCLPLIQAHADVGPLIH